MSDLDRLRSLVDEESGRFADAIEAMRNAADTIERLRLERDSLRVALGVALNDLESLRSGEAAS